MKIVVLGMYRSGHNAIARWLLRQSDLGDKPLPRFGDFDWIEHSVLFEDESYGFISQINHPHHKHYGSYDNTVWSIESQALPQSNVVIDEHAIQDATKVLVVRDFRNWAASVCQMKGSRWKRHPYESIVVVERYITHLKEITNPTDWHVIKYNDWFSDKDYRQDTCDKLNLSFTDGGMDNVEDNGGGSSFNGTEFDGRGSQMNVLNRWVYLRDTEYFKTLLKLYETVDSMSQDIFGPYN